MSDSMDAPAGDPAAGHQDRGLPGPRTDRAARRRTDGPSRWQTGAAVCLAASAAGLVAAAPAGAAASVLFVNQGAAGCTDAAGGGTATKPYCTIGAGAAAAAPGQTVQVAAGTYRERVVPRVSGTSAARITYAAAPNVIVTGQSNGFALSGKGWITVRGFTVTKTTGVGIDAGTGAHDLVIDRNNVSFSGQPVQGLIANGISLRAVTRVTVSANTTHHNSSAGIAVESSSTGVRVTGNETYSNARGYTRAAAGIDVRNSAGTVVSGNRSHHNEDSGINVWTSSTGSTAVNNVVYRNGDHGIDVHSTNDARIVGNTVYRNVDSGIEETGSLRTRLANNISVDNGINSPRTAGNLRADAASAPSTVVDYDLLFLSASGTFIDWGGTTYSSLAAFRTATGQEAHGLEADPLFQAAAADNLKLSATSPAIDSADSGAPGQTSVDAVGTPRTDIAGVPNTGAGPRLYDDRGAFEFQ